ncbi:HTH domain-containing protein [Halorientalis brevis]|uniref:HTH domain-containing protein n=1 Tax=Halorientalis brevis TaxID=1126241 RepID=A0ABD6C934_9EURY|nr:HTH domain-containing protein [Halorientalis brevis]
MVANAVEVETRDSSESDATTRSEEEMTDGESADAFAVTAHLRASPTGAAARRQQAVLDRLRSLEATGTIEDLTIERWGARVNVPVSEADRDDAVALYAELERAAARTGVQLEPFFESRKAVGGLLSSGPPTERIIVFPVVSITIRRAGELTGLYPCWSDGVHERVEDCLGALANDDPVENLD